MRFAFILTAIILLAGCGGAGSAPTAPQTTWQPPNSYIAATQAAVASLTGPPAAPGVCYYVNIDSNVPGIQFVFHGPNGFSETVFGRTSLNAPKTTVWATVIVPTGYIFQGWNHEGTVGTFYSNGLNATFTCPETANPTNYENNATVITAILAPVGAG